MPVNIPVPDKTAGDVFTESMWDLYIRDNINRLLQHSHRTVTVAQFSGLTGLEDGEEVYLEVDAANGVLWHLIYETQEPTYKWRYLGGPALDSQVATTEAQSNAAYAALATAGPSVALPRSGDYDVVHGAAVTGGDIGMMSYDIGATGAVDADAVKIGFADTASFMRTKRKTALTSVTLTAKYKRTSGGNASFGERFLQVTPIRLRHDA